MTEWSVVLGFTILLVGIITNLVLLAFKYGGVTKTQEWLVREDERQEVLLKEYEASQSKSFNELKDVHIKEVRNNQVAILERLAGINGGVATTHASQVKLETKVDKLQDMMIQGERRLGIVESEVLNRRSTDK